MSSDLEVRLAQAAPIPLDVAFTCPAGEMLALVGPSGSGKTTILRAVAGLQRADTGHVACAGRVLFDDVHGIDLAPQARRVGLVFQDYALFPHLTALDNVRVALQGMPGEEREARARGWLARTRMAGLEGRRPDQLSGGEQQRVALARALARDPAMLLLDEPFSAVDQVTRHRLRLEFADLARSLEIPIVLVTHDLDEASMLADRICVLHRGRTLQHGPPGEVLAHPVSAEVARLIDTRNIHEAVVAGHDADGGWTELAWGARVLRAGHAPWLLIGEAVAWCVTPTNVLLIPDRARREDGENGFDTTVVGLLVGGALSQAVLRCRGGQGDLLHMTLPTRVARRHELAVGRELRVSLPREAIHLMPPRAQRTRGEERAVPPAAT
ncbi:MAG: ABC transporter ATP-binding protein [Gammaproteobacteria bacterium]|nr:ABC transporter ATP-binding protein [Gammaproteobacteria bacterium]